MIVKVAEMQNNRFSGTVCKLNFGKGINLILKCLIYCYLNTIINFMNTKNFDVNEKEKKLLWVKMFLYFIKYPPPP